MKSAGNIGPTWRKADWRWLKMAEFEPDTSVEVWRRTIRLHKPKKLHQMSAGSFQLTSTLPPPLLYSETLSPRALVLERPNEALNWLSTMKENKHFNPYIWQKITSKCHYSVYSSLNEFHVSVFTWLARSSLRALLLIKQLCHEWNRWRRMRSSCLSLREWATPEDWRGRLCWGHYCFN